MNKYDFDLKVLPINDLSRLDNHLNYLCRTDARQKWTNELTGGNIYFYRATSGGFQFSAIEGREEREKFKRYVMYNIQRDAALRGLSEKEFVHCLKQGRSDYRDEAVYEYTEAVHDDTVELIKRLQREIDGFRLVCGVVHTDQKQDYVHIHLLYFED